MVVLTCSSASSVSCKSAVSPGDRRLHQPCIRLSDTTGAGVVLLLEGSWYLVVSP